MIRVTWPLGSMRIKASGRSTYLAGGALREARRQPESASSMPPPAARLTFRNSAGTGADDRFSHSGQPTPRTWIQVGTILTLFARCGQKPGKAGIFGSPGRRAACDRNRGSRVALAIWHGSLERTIDAYRYCHAAAPGGAAVRDSDSDPAPAAQLSDRDLSDPDRAGGTVSPSFRPRPR